MPGIHVGNLLFVEIVVHFVVGFFDTVGIVLHLESCVVGNLVEVVFL